MTSAKRPAGVTIVGLVVIALSVLACLGVIAAAVSWNQGKLWSAPKILKMPYDLLLYSFNHVFKKLSHTLFVLGLGIIIPGALTVCGYFLLRMKNLARKFLIVFSWFNLWGWVFGRALDQMQLGGWSSIIEFSASKDLYLAMALYGAAIYYLSRQATRIHFKATG